MFHHVGHSRDVAITWHEGCSPIFNRIWRLDLDLHRGLMAQDPSGRWLDAPAISDVLAAMLAIA
jgi:hypothetical protein